MPRVWSQGHYYTPPAPDAEDPYGLLDDVDRVLRGVEMALHARNLKGVRSELRAARKLVERIVDTAERTKDPWIAGQAAKRGAEIDARLSSLDTGPVPPGASPAPAVTPTAGPRRRKQVLIPEPKPTRRGRSGR